MILRKDERQCRSIKNNFKLIFSINYLGPENLVLLTMNIFSYSAMSKALDDRKGSRSNDDLDHILGKKDRNANKCFKKSKFLQSLKCNFKFFNVVLRKVRNSPFSIRK